MAGVINFPSPSTLLASPDAAPSIPPSVTSEQPSKKPKQKRKRIISASPPIKGVESGIAKAARSTAPLDSSAGNADDIVSAGKPKQTKSRNGCLTCKVKRLKCDETHPMCQQCARRNVKCGGYKKDFKWRAFGEANFAEGKMPSFRAAHKAQRALEDGLPRYQVEKLSPVVDVIEESDDEEVMQGQSGEALTIVGSVNSRGSDDLPEDCVDLGMTSLQPLDVRQSLPTNRHADGDQLARTMSNDHGIIGHMDEDYLNTSPPLAVELTHHSFAGNVCSDLPLPVGCSTDYFPVGTSYGLMSNLAFDGLPDLSENAVHIDFGLLSTSLSASMPTVNDVDLLLGSSVDTSVLETPIYDGCSSYDVVADGGEVMYRDPDLNLSLATAHDSLLQRSRSQPFPDIPRSPKFGINSMERLVMAFDVETCGILSMKDGPTENPWRTIVWPLAQENPALYHAIASLTSFHTADGKRELVAQGADHMWKSALRLREDITKMRFESAIATTLILAFAESWDTHTKTGINHIKAAKVLINQAIAWNERQPFTEERLVKLRFLFKIWIYMNVIARITSAENDVENDFDVVFSKLSLKDDVEVDPLMGAATTLFPIIGYVANLVRRVRGQSGDNSPFVISEALRYKKMLDGWTPPLIDEVPEDPTLHPEDSIRTAESYRWATLLYLHQAVPELPSDSSAELAQRVMTFLATVSPDSRSVIVQIFPLLAAGCEADDVETREWVIARWKDMERRMRIGIIDKCATVTKEVWDRRDKYRNREGGKISQTHTRGSSSSGQVTASKPFMIPASRSSLADTRRRASESLFDLGFERLFSEAQRQSFGASFASPSPKAQAKSLPSSSLAEGSMQKTNRSSIGGPAKLDKEFTVKGRLHWLGVMSDWNWEILLG